MATARFSVGLASSFDGLSSLSKLASEERKVFGGGFSVRSLGFLSAAKRTADSGLLPLDNCGFSSVILVDSFGVAGFLGFRAITTHHHAHHHHHSEWQTISPLSDSPTTDRFLRFPIRNPPPLVVFPTPSPTTRPFLLLLYVMVGPRP